jgi:hypothetical protein
MKRNFIKDNLLLLFCAIMLTSNAQTNEEVKTIFGSEKRDIGYFINPSFKFGEIAGSTAIIPGIGAGVVLNNKMYFGLNYQYIASENTPAGESDNRLYLDQRWGGLKFEYSFQPKNAIHFNFPVELGIGETELDLKDFFEDEFSVPAGDAWFAYIEPGVALEINIHKNVKINFAAGYRFVSDFTFRNLTEKEIMGITCSAGLKIGIFQPSLK